MCKGCDLFYTKLESGKLNHLLPDTDTEKWAAVYSAAFMSVVKPGVGSLILMMTAIEAGLTPHDVFSVAAKLSQEHLACVKSEEPDKVFAYEEIARIFAKESEKTKKQEQSMPSLDMLRDFNLGDGEILPN